MAFNKPRGIVCTADRSDPSNIVDCIGYPKRVFTVGRLDKDTEGLILLTNDGDLADRIMRSRYEHEKEYVVKVDADVTQGFVEEMSKGVDIGRGQVTRPCDVEVLDLRTVRIVLRQGLNRQIRRMCLALGYGVADLRRVRVMNIKLRNLKPGSYREISRSERRELLRLLEESTLADKDSERVLREKGKGRGSPLPRGLSVYPVHEALGRADLRGGHEDLVLELVVGADVHALNGGG
ncbi:pseudouridine synthase [Methanomassiliicoccaceae archaeon COG_1]|nr:pseudouridine synthase [Methanomassiliicoccaceae archaeon COG_1]